MLKLPENLATLGDCIQWGAEKFDQAGLFYGHGTDNAWDESLTMVLYVLSLPWDADPSVLEQRINRDQIERLGQLFQRRIEEQIPAAYLTGEAWFAGLKFYVDQRVLVPRSPIGELIESQFSPWLLNEPAQILDLCTGSGCIGIACAYAFPTSKVTLSDISLDALAVAGVNIDNHQLRDRVSAIESDLFAGLGDQRYDLIVSNPPYVDADDLAAMPQEYHHEPEIGLSSGTDGLDFTRRLLAEAIDHLNPSGLLIVEVGNSWVALEQAYPNVPFIWLEFERGGHGVFILSAEELQLHREEFISA